MKNTQPLAQNISFILLVLAATLLFAWVIHGFFQPVFWAALLAVVFYPLYAFFLRLLGGRTRWASLLTLVIIVLGVVIPLGLLGLSVMHESMSLYERISAGDIQLSKAMAYLERTVPVLTQGLEKAGLDWEKITEDLSQTAVTGSRLVATNLVSIGQNALRLGVMLALAIYLLYFFLKDGEWLIGGIMRVVPLDHERQQSLAARFAQVSKATVKGTFVVAVVQGGLGGLFFWILGIQAATLWGVIMTILSLIPMLGSALVWGPAAVILIATGSVVQGVVLLGAGSILIGLADNVLRPLLVGRETRLPDYVVLISTLGGIGVFGVSGLVVGPVAAALFLTVWEMFGEEFGRLGTSDR
ncbi:AI-2E family transporter [Desulfovermiculus halophilus]|uniref:AI-2E family transporter n=1 Tax=Desulfovermiculus halophilus TaxID=339722 RepID=UPI0004801E73|nr:AI-2E family transporter [Desulfovermiculus halophilus]